MVYQVIILEESKKQVTGWIDRLLGDPTIHELVVRVTASRINARHVRGGHVGGGHAARGVSPLHDIQGTGM